MTDPKERVFREEALERLSSPERLDQLVQIVQPRHWLLLGTLVLLVAGALYWSINGRLPTTMIGRGMLLQPRTAVQGASVPVVCRAYFAVQDGKRIEPGMRVQVVPDTVKRERFGGIAGRIQTVSQLPVSREAVAAALGGQDVAALLLAAPPCIEVNVELERDLATFSGFHWTLSQGPRIAITPGTTTTVRVIIEERAPISYLLPMLRSTSGIY